MTNQTREIWFLTGSQNLYGVPAYPNYDYDTEDRSVLTREL